MDETKYVLQIVETFTNSINGLNQTFGSLTVLLGDIIRKLDQMPKEEFVLKLKDSWHEEIMGHFENIEVDEKIEFILLSIKTHFAELRRDLSKYEKFMETLQQKAINDLCLDEEAKKIEAEKEKEEAKFNQEVKLKTIDHSHAEKMFIRDKKFAFWFKILTGIGAMSVIIFQAIKKFYFGM